MADNSHAAAAAELAKIIISRTPGHHVLLGSANRDGELAKIFAIYGECLDAVRLADRRPEPR